jgi:8-oxo-dGTP pyrophosphatase MutT (NUDIX family)
VVVCRDPKTGKWLAVDESRNRGWWLPAGAVDAGENFVQAAHRETMEEAGIEINLLGILRVDYKVKED